MDTILHTIPRAIWNDVLRKRPPSHFTRVCILDEFTEGITKPNRGNLRKVAMLFTGHSTLNYHLSKYEPDIFSKTLPHCLAEEETTKYYIKDNPKVVSPKNPFIGSFYLSITEVYRFRIYTEFLA